MSSSVILLSFDDHQTFEVNGIQEARQCMDEQQVYSIHLNGCRATDDDDYAAIQAYRDLLLTTVGGD